MRKKHLIIAFTFMVLAQLIFPLKMILEREFILLKGETFLFQIEPLDPYDAFRGRYVNIRYHNNKVDLPIELQNLKDIKELYITVEKDNSGMAFYGKITKEKPTSTNSYLSQKADLFYEYSYTNMPRNLWIDLPNRYYMNENKAPIAERLLSEAYAEVVIYRGQAILKGIQVEGMPIEKYINTLEKDKSH